MSDIRCSKKHLVVIRPKIGQSVYETTKKLSDFIVELTTDEKLFPETHIILDLAPFSIISSTLIGSLCGSIDRPEIEMIALCGMTPSAKRITARLGIEGKKSASRLIEKDAHKFQIFDSIEDGICAIFSEGRG